MAVRPAFAQSGTDGGASTTPAQTATPHKTIFRDSDGNLISNNEFVDIRMANFHMRDQTRVQTLSDGTIEFRLQKIPQEEGPAPLFSGETVDGKPLTYGSLQGKVVVLNFWFIACAACRSETPLLNKFAAKFAGNDDVKFIAITYDPAAEVRRYLKNNRFDYTVMADAENALKMFVVGGYPKNIVIGRDGKIVYWRSTITAWDKFESVVRTELDKK
ncbi:MAG: TlpA disulfide reductase family protein [Acidobacteriota bacterium]